MLAAAAVAGLAGAALADPAGSSQGAFQSPASPVAREINSLFVTITIIAFIVGIVVEALLVYTLLKFRALQSGAADGSPEDDDGREAEGGGGGKRPLPPHYHNKKVEAGITGFTAVAFALLVVFSWGTLNAIETPSEPVDLNIEVVAHQWSWEFNYPAQGVTEAASLSEMHVPKDAVVRLNVSSTDVAHAVWIPDLGVKIDAYPGRINQFWFKAEKEGRFLLQCAEFCGGAHSNMHAVVVSESRSAFDLWVQAKVAAANPPPPPLSTGAVVQVNLSDFRIETSAPLNIDLNANITFNVRNAGPSPHAFALDAPYNFSTAVLNAGESVTVNIAFGQEVANGVFYCPVAGHRAAGMSGSFNVSAAARVIDIHMFETPGSHGAWSVSPETLDLRPGEVVKFRVINDGTAPHNLIVGPPYNAESPIVGAGATTFTPAITVTTSAEYWCNVPGHKEIGMLGQINAGGAAPRAPAETVPGFELTLALPSVLAAALFAARARKRRAA